MKRIFTVLYILTSGLLFSQNDIEWDGQYRLQLSDFQSASTQVGNVTIYSLHTTAGVEFSFYMSNFEFMFAKNFNAKVNNTFKKNTASLVAPDPVIAEKIINFAQFEFDLAELYARKFRKKIFEEKGAFSNVTFFRPIYDDIQKEFSERDTNAGKESDIGQKSDRLKILHEQVLNEIQELADFCKTCKPPKKKK